MESEILTRGLLYLSLTLLGVPGNSIVIWAFVRLAYQERHLLPADAIVLHLASANLIVVGVRCLLESLATFQLSDVFSDTGCKAVIFLYRTSRSLSIWLTFVLSAYQCLSTAAPGSRWAAVRALAARNLGCIFLVLWLINTSMSSAAVLFSLSSRNNSSLMQHGINVQFCFVHFPSKLSRDANGAAQVSRDVLPMALMTTASLIILFFLYHHTHQVKSVHKSTCSRGGSLSSERRAAITVVTLVTLYVIFYGVDNGLWVYTLTVKETMSSSVVSDLRVFFSSLYAAVSPFVIIVSNKKVKKLLKCELEEKLLLNTETALSSV
ncbi:olfactory receptor class A-like protein 1 [Alosa alosa]|uniref:olfactory receptor class A-like protein 1 n=1 Tax=Alosa alosa TaxID=278164 RepID=UPI002015389F|nr:olfactory receptor class A-like protein 1 [Alosa alosa]